MAFSATFRCFRGCEGRYPLTRAIYRCPTCDGLLAVQHDMAALSEVKGAEWRARFDARWSATSSSGVWSKREWVAPEVPDEAIVTTGEGMTFVLVRNEELAPSGHGRVDIEQRRQGLDG